MKKPVFVLVAGSNGAGKSTLTSHYGKQFNYPVVDPDAIAKNMEQASSAANVAAGKKAILQIREYIKERKSFIAETTLSGSSYLRVLQSAKDSGFRTEVVYVALNSVKQAKTRVAERVKDGGHHISKEDIDRRYQRSFDNLQKAIEIADRTKILLNSKDHYSKVAKISQEEIALYRELSDLPNELGFLGELAREREEIKSKLEADRDQQDWDRER